MSVASIGVSFSLSHLLDFLFSLSPWACLPPGPRIERSSGPFVQRSHPTRRRRTLEMSEKGVKKRNTKKQARDIRQSLSAPLKRGENLKTKASSSLSCITTKRACLRGGEFRTRLSEKREIECKSVGKIVWHYCFPLSASCCTCKSTSLPHSSTLSCPLFPIFLYRFLVLSFRHSQRPSFCFFRQQSDFFSHSSHSFLSTLLRTQKRLDYEAALYEYYLSTFVRATWWNLI